MSNEMWVSTITLSQWSRTSKPTGNISLAGADGMASSFPLSEDEAAELQRLAARFFNNRKKEFANAVATANPLMALEYKTTVDATPADDDEIPFWEARLMTPEKTGAQIWLEEYYAWAICDAFKLPEGQYLFRITVVGYEQPLRPTNNYIVGHVEHWWKDNPVQTMIATEVEYLGYDGVSL